MRIRTRLTLWYAAVMLASLTLMGVLSYVEFVREPATERPRLGQRLGGRPPQRLRRGDGDHPVVRRPGGRAWVWSADGG